VSDQRPSAVPAPEAALGRSDPTRRWALELAGRRVFPGLTLPEVDAAAAWLAQLKMAEMGEALVVVALPVVLAEGAGPYLLDASGHLVLAVADHPHLAGARVAVGQSGPGFVVGLVRPALEGGWRWRARAEVVAAERVAALDELDAVSDEHAAAAWSERWRAA
jgi:hypothetical protein